MKRLIAILACLVGLTAWGASPVKYVGTHVGDGSALSNLVFKTSPFDFPPAGSVHSTLNKWQTQMLSDGTTETVLLDTTGRGVVRSIQLFIEFTDYYTEQGIQKVRLLGYYDGAVTADFNVPLSCLLGEQAVGYGDSYFKWSTMSVPWFKKYVCQTNYNMGIDWAIVLRYPIPYTNGIKLTLKPEALDSPTDQYIASTVIYQDELPSCWNACYRFLPVYSSNNLAKPVAQTGTISGNIPAGGTGTITGAGGADFTGLVGAYLGGNVGGYDELLVTAVSDSAHLTATCGPSVVGYSASAFNLDSAYTFLNRPVGKVGYVAAIMPSWIPSTAQGGLDRDWFEANPHLFVNQEAIPSIMWTAGEDFLGGAFYNMTAEPDDVNGFMVETGASVSGYRLFLEDPIAYTNGVRGVTVNSCTKANTTSFNWCTVVYEKMP